MSDINRPTREGQIFSLSMPSDYWLHRAAKHRQRGDNRTAAALLRHALAMKPLDGDLRTEYALCLQELSCYESSNRECFDVLAREPESLQCYAIIGRNMLALGREQEAMDAYAHYLRLLRDAPDEMLVSEDYDDVQDMFEMSYQPRIARYNCRLRLASRSLTRGENKKAAYHLERAQRLKCKDERVFTLQSVMLLEQKKRLAALRRAKQAVRRAPRSVQALCALSGAYNALGRRYQALSALSRCIPLCVYAREEQLLCFTALELGLLPICVRMLKNNIRQCPDRLPTLYNMAVALLHQGKLNEAAGYIHRCRELDPEDMPTARTFAMVERLMESPPTSKSDIAEQMSRMPFYPHLSPAETAECLKPLWDALREGAEQLKRLLITDRDTQAALMYALSLPQLGIERMLPLLADAEYIKGAEELLRRVLVSPATCESAKRTASSLLVSMGASPPYVVWHDGHISQLSIKRAERDMRPALRALMIKIGAKWQDPRLNTLCVRLIRLMSESQRALVARDGMPLWGEALNAFYSLSESARRDPAKAIKEMKGQSLKHRIRSAVLALSDLYCGKEG